MCVKMKLDSSWGEREAGDCICVIDFKIFCSPRELKREGDKKEREDAPLEKKKKTIFSLA